MRPTAARPLRAGVLVLLIATACSTRSSAPSPSPAHPSLSVARDEQARPGPRRDPPSLAAAEPATVPVVRTGQLRDQPVTAAQVPVVPMSPVYDVGDSLTVGAQPYLQEDIAGIAVNGRVGRQWNEGVTILAALRRQGRLPTTVIVDLGTNGAVTPSMVDAMMRAAAGARRLVLVTIRVPRSWETASNAAIRDGVARYRDTGIADWYSVSQGHREWFRADGFHLTPGGSRALAALIASAVHAQRQGSTLPA